MGQTHTNNKNITMDANIIEKSMWIHGGIIRRFSCSLDVCLGIAWRREKTPQ